MVSFGLKGLKKMTLIFCLHCLLQLIAFSKCGQSSKQSLTRMRDHSCEFTENKAEELFWTLSSPYNVTSHPSCFWYLSIAKGESLDVKLVFDGQTPWDIETRCLVFKGNGQEAISEQFHGKYEGRWCFHEGLNITYNARKCPPAQPRRGLHITIRGRKDKQPYWNGKQLVKFVCKRNQIKDEPWEDSQSGSVTTERSGITMPSYTLFILTAGGILLIIVCMVLGIHFRHQQDVTRLSFWLNKQPTSHNNPPPSYNNVPRCEEQPCVPMREVRSKPAPPKRNPSIMSSDSDYDDAEDPSVSIVDYMEPSDSVKLPRRKPRLVEGLEVESGSSSSNLSTQEEDGNCPKNSGPESMGQITVKVEAYEQLNVDSLAAGMLPLYTPLVQDSVE